MSTPTRGGATNCPKRCSDCPDNDHHWVFEDMHTAEGEHDAMLSGYTEWLQCRHCSAWTAAEADLDEHCDGGGL